MSSPTVDVHVDPEVPLVYVGGDEQFAMPARFTATVEPSDPKLPICHLSLVVEGGVAVCDEVRLQRRAGGPPLSGTLIRVPLTEYVRLAADDTGRWVLPADTSPTLTWADGETFPLRTQRFDDEHVATPTGGVTRTAGYKAASWTPREVGRVSDKTLRDVAAVFEAAQAAQAAPVSAVMQKWVVSRSTANRWVRRAREAGHLAPPARGGEQS